MNCDFADNIVRRVMFYAQRSFATRKTRVIMATQGVSTVSFSATTLDGRSPNNVRTAHRGKDTVATPRTPTCAAR